jgi:hydroxymethylpyrimidine pyrophosphatase-like HAD family hydrolase
MEKKRNELSLKEFYKLMRETRDLKQEILSLILKNKKVPKSQIIKLRKYHDFLKNLKKQNSKYVLYYKNKEILSGLNYELSELDRDLIYLEKGEKALLKKLENSNKNFHKQKQKIIEKLSKNTFNLLITDRDGTINNYSERYLSSVQSIYNAVFLSRFISEKTRHSIILTSASLNDFQKVNIFPRDFMKTHGLTLAGSKGSEFFSKDNEKVRVPLNKKEKQKLKLIETRIKEIISKKQYEIFSLIGSGFQVKHGQLTIARQDMLKSVKKSLSEKFAKEVKEIVKKTDLNSEYFTVHDTGLDIEITFKLMGRKFNKYKGVKFTLSKLGLQPKNSLVCGDTHSDLDFFDYIEEESQNYSAIFVTSNPKVKNKIRKIFPKTLFISSPDILIAALNEISKNTK